MIDTIALKHYLVCPPASKYLCSQGWLPIYSRRDGTLCAYVRNEPERSDEPRLTLLLSPNLDWHLKAEVSLPSLLHGANVPLLDENERVISLRLLSAYVERWSGCKFDPQTAFVCRVDFTQDIQVSESAIIPIIAKLMRLQIPRYDRKQHNDTGVVFTPKGKSIGKRISVYNKLSEVEQRTGSEIEQSNAQGILRLEVGLKTRAISYLVKKLKLPNREGQHVLTPRVADFVLQEAKSKLQFDAITIEGNEDIERLITRYGTSRAKSLLGFMEMRRHFGEELYKNQRLHFPPRTYFRDLADCRKAGVLP